MSMTNQYNKAHLSFLLSALLFLRGQAEDGFIEAGPSFDADETTGICGNVSRYVNKALLPDDILAMSIGKGGSRQCVEDTFNSMKDELFSSWPHYSGNKFYPVPAPLWQREAMEYCTMADAAEYVFDNSDLFWEGEYGDYRMSLLNHMIDRITEALVVEEPVGPVSVPDTSGVTTYGTQTAAHKPSHGGYPG